ncbi:U3 small nucleolar RNA-associated protein 20-like isoform X1 [Zingiber officinale]|uniref:U3 small nucleolar RNA-associated protein 20-like isoform X1 n=1 Tax=Zingiber officinale TaxID=94328 RepID=UPI001C4CEB4F|nr:U3 small nucleolar RNA-associated protein 20-like isoform X1 [Zingiber officinale]
MTTSQSQAVKSLNTSAGRRRFTFKSFSQRVEEIQINVFHSLDSVKAQPSDGSSFLRESLIYWKELNTAEDFISFYENMMPFVQTLSQVILHKETIMTELLDKVKIEAILSLEPILRLIAALSRDLLDEFLFFLPRLVDSLVILLKNGGDRDPEVIEQIFTSWSYIMMYLQKYLVRDLVYVLKITADLRYFPKHYVQEFMAESVSFLLRNSCKGQLQKGVRKAIREAAKTKSSEDAESKSSSSINGVSALLWYAMRGVSLLLHSRAETVWQILIDTSTFTMVEKYTKGSKALLEVTSGILRHLCTAIDPKELEVIYNCLFEETSKCITNRYLDQLNHLLSLLVFLIDGNKIIDGPKLLNLVDSFVQSFVVPSIGVKVESVTHKVLKKVLKLMLHLLDIPSISVDISSILPLYVPAFKLNSSSLCPFLDELILKEPQIVQVFRSHILSAMDDLIEDSPEETLSLMLTFFAKQSKYENCYIVEVSEDKVHMLCNFLREKIVYWIKLFGTAESNNQLYKQIPESEVAILWGVICCFPYFPILHEKFGLFKELINSIDQFLEAETDKIENMLKSTWQGILGGVLSSYHKLLLVNKLATSEVKTFLNLAKKHKSSLQVLSSVAEYLDSISGTEFEEDSSLKAFQKVDEQDAVDAVISLAVNLSHPNKAICLSTLRILFHYRPRVDALPSNDIRPCKKLKTDQSGANNEISQHTDVIKLLLSVEATPLSIFTSRNAIVLLQNLQISLSSGRIGDSYIPLLFNGIIGILHNRFSQIWEAALECLATLISQYKELVWIYFVHYLDLSQSKIISENPQLEAVTQELNDDNSDDDIVVIAPASADFSLVKRFKLYLAPAFDCTPSVTIITLLLHSLQKISDIAESRSRQLIPLFLKFLGYGANDNFSFESYAGHACQRKDWKVILKEWLNLLVRMCNAKSLYQSAVLKEVLMKRLLDDVDADIQLKVLDCLLNWKDDFLISYEKHLKNLIISKNLREGLATWSVSKESQCIQEEHRCHLIPILIRLLTPKVWTLKTLGSRKHTGLALRKAILCFLAQLEVDELLLFFMLLLKPLLPRPRANEVLDVQTAEASTNITHGSSSSILNKYSTSILVADLSWKQKYGFLHVIDEILRIFDEAHIKPYLNALLKIVGWILESCMPNLSSGDSLSNSKMTSKQLKDLRSLCLKIISFVLNKYVNHDFESDFWDIFFRSTKPLLDSFKHEGSSGERLNLLLSCFISMSKSTKLLSLLEREANLVPTIFSALSLSTASDAIIYPVLEFIENLLNLDNSEDHLENKSVKNLLVPHIDVLIQSLHGHLLSRNEAYRKSINWPGNAESRVLKLLARYIVDPVVAGQFVDILLPCFKKKNLNIDDALSGLLVLKGTLSVVGSESYEKILKAILPLLVSSGLDVRLCICDILHGLKDIDSSIASVAKLLCDLNAVSSSLLGELDYDRRISAYEKIKPGLFSELKVEHVMLILSHCVYDMSHVELIFRQSASNALLSFIHFAASVLENSEDNSSKMLLNNETQEVPEDHILKKEDSQSKWTKKSIKQIVNTTFLSNVGGALNKDISVLREWFAVLRGMVYYLNGLPSLNPLKSLYSEDDEVDFFNNIVHLQIHRRKRAVLRFRNILGSGNLTEDLIAKIFLPLFFKMLLDQDGKGLDLANVCLDTIASIAGHMQSWDSYRSLLMKSFKEIAQKPDKQKVLLRLICAILDNFPFSNKEIPKALNDQSEISAPEAKANLSNVEALKYLQNVFFPQIQKLLTSDTLNVNVNFNLAAIKVLKLLPVEIKDSHLSTIIHRVCCFLKNRLESIRDEARSALVACLKELGLKYLQYVVKVLQAILKRGYELHVLGYTVNFILSKTLVNIDAGELDYCLEDLLTVAEADILGDVAEEKEVEKIASKMKETKKKKSYETLELIAQRITFRTHAIKLLSPISAHLQKHVTPRVKVRLQTMLQHIALGIERNSSVETSELFHFVYELIKGSFSPEGSQGYWISNEGIQKTSVGKMSQKMRISNSSKHDSHNTHLIVVFALGLLLNHVKKLMKMELLKNDEQLLSMLDPFVSLLSNCLCSKYEDVLAAAFRCLALLVTKPLPSIETHADNITSLLLEIVQKSGNVGSSLVQSCLKVLTVLLRRTSISLTNRQLQLLIHFPVFMDIQTKPSPIALSLLKSIIHQKLVVHEIYDIVVQVAELMVASHSEPIRKKSNEVLLQFLLNYPLSDKRLQQHMDFLLANLSYEHLSGREVVLQTLYDILKKFPASVVDSQAQSFFLHLVVALANEQDIKLRGMICGAMKVLLDRISQHVMHSIVSYTISWYTGEKSHLWSASAEVLSLLVQVMKKDFWFKIGNILQVMRDRLKSSAHAAGSSKDDILKDAAVPLWKEAYYSLILLDNMLQHFPDLYFEENVQEIWMIICKLMLHPHTWVRCISSSLVHSYFTTVKETSKRDDQKLKSRSYFLLCPSRLFAIAALCLNQLKTHLIDEKTSNLIRENLVFSTCALHSRLANTPVPHKYWSTLDSHEQSIFLEAFEILGSRGTKDAFLLSTTARSDSLEKINHIYEDKQDLRSLLVIPLLKSMGKISMQMRDTQMQVIFDSFTMMFKQIDSEGLQAYATYILIPLYKVCEGFSGKVISDKTKQLAGVVCDALRDKIGVENFVHIYNVLRQKFKEKREKKRNMQKQLAVINPMRFAKRKLQLAAKHTVHKRRRIMSMRMQQGRS